MLRDTIRSVETTLKPKLAKFWVRLWCGEVGYASSGNVPVVETQLAFVRTRGARG